ncbi:unnamed protein product [Gordionus sp. m RMFG-2023]
MNVFVILTNKNYYHSLLNKVIENYLFRVNVYPRSTPNLIRSEGIVKVNLIILTKGNVLSTVKRMKSLNNVEIY